MPLFFGPSQRPLFGAYHPAAQRGDRGVVLCNPWGEEYLCAHPSLGLLARQLAGAGNHVLRFDYGGTGDSGGMATEGTLKTWRDDLEWALDEIRDLGDVRKIAIVGLRLGGTLAALAAAERKDVDRLVLWDPVVDGSDYVRELLHDPEKVTHSSAHADLARREGREVPEIGGFALTPAMRRGLEEIDGSSFTGPLPATLLVSIHRSAAALRPIVDRLGDCASSLRTEITEDPTIWLGTEEFGAGGMSVNAVRVITEWLT